jgi:hypothetical protein
MSDLEIAQDNIDRLVKKLAIANRAKTTADRGVHTAANTAADNNKARGALPALNKVADDARRLVREIEAEIREAKKRLEQVRSSIAVSSAASAAAATAHLPPGTRLFEVQTPDLRKVRHRHRSPDALQATLAPGYKVTAEIFGAGSDNCGGVAASIGGVDVPSLMAGLLRASGKELISFLQANGYEPSNRDCYND